MKYTDKNPPLECIMYNSTCYKGSRTYTPRGVVWHSTGANNPNIKRYVNPDNKNKNKDELIRIIGKNGSNDWNHIERQAGVTAWIGYLADKSISTVIALPLTMRSWSVGSGKRGSLNNTHLSFEICESAMTDLEYFKKAYVEACEFTAYICKKFNFDPHGSFQYQGVNVPVITCHQDAYKMGLGSNHADVNHILPLIGKSMATVRDDVAKIMAGGSLNSKPQQSTPTPKPEPPKQEPKPQPPKEDDDMDVKRFGELMDEYRKTLQDNDAADWSKAARDWAVSSGLIQGGVVNGTPNYMWADYLTREQLAQTLYRFAQMMGKA